MGSHDKAELLTFQARRDSKKLLGENHPDHAQSSEQLRGLYWAMALYDKAEPLMLQARDLHKKLLGENHPAYALSLEINLKALLYNSMGSARQGRAALPPGPRPPAMFLGEKPAPTMPSA
ncbi:MAG: tetratricopeptide repeat protein [Gemmataceae bacterium]